MKVLTILGLEIKFKRNQYIVEKIYCRFLNRFAKVKNNKIVFINLTNWQYADNPKYIAQELLNREYKNYDLTWITNKGTIKSLIPKNFKLVDYSSIEALKELLTARIWIINANMFLLYKKGLRKRKETICFQTWHGSMGIKRESADAKSNAYQNNGWLELQKLTTKDYDYIFVDNNFEKEIYTTAFWGNGEILKLGKARDSIFYKDSETYIKKVKEYYKIPQENKILLYAPTWRSDKRCNCYNIDITLLKKSLIKRFGGIWSILIRPHYLMPKQLFNALYDSNQVINCSNYVDMQELLVASDILISDYSSCIPEYTILGKPSFIYATDLKTYENGFYYPLETLPSLIATDNGELSDAILNFDEIKFNAKNKAFLEKMGHNDDTNSCKRIVDFILGEIRKNG